MIIGLQTHKYEYITIADLFCFTPLYVSLGTYLGRGLAPGPLSFFEGENNEKKNK